MKIRNAIKMSLLSGFLLANPVAPEPGKYPENIRIEIVKKDRKLSLYRGDRLIESFNASFGSGEIFNYADKDIRGDKKTPEGEYYITLKHPSKKMDIS